MRNDRRIYAWIAVLACVLVFALPLSSYAATPTKSINVKDYGAFGTDKADDRAAINAALAEAKNFHGALTVNIPKGTYYISGDLKIYSDTTLKCASGVKIISTNPKWRMLSSAHLMEDGSECANLKTCTHGAYTQVHNVQVIGGTWDRNAPKGDGNNGILLISHAHNVTLKDMTVKGCTNHFFNVSGSMNITISNCHFSDNVMYSIDDDFWGDAEYGAETRLRAIEAIHLDYIADEGEFTFPFDDTGCQNVVVEGCSFTNVYSGIGTHHEGKGDREHGLIVRDCQFTNVLGTCVRAIDFEDVLVEGNVATDVGNLFSSTGKSTLASHNLGNRIIDVQDGTVNHYDIQILNNNVTNSKVNNTIVLGGTKRVLVEGNTINKGVASGVIVRDDASAIVRSNKISSMDLRGVQIEGNSAAVVEGNTIKNVKAMGVLLSETATGLVRNNTISGTATAGVHVIKQANAIVDNNKIINAGKHGIYVDSEGSAVSITGNTITNPTGHGVLVGGISLVRVSSNIITGITGDLTAGVRVGGDAIARVTHNDISNVSATSFCVSAIANSSVVIDSNTLDGGRYGIHISSEGTSSNIAIANTVTNSVEHAVMVDNYSQVVLEYNQISSSAKCGLQLVGSSLVEAYGNVVENAGWQAINIGGNSLVEMHDNTISNPGRASDAAYPCGIVINTSNPVTVQGNTISGAPQRGIFVAKNCAMTVIADNKVNGSGESGIHASEGSSVRIIDNTVENSGKFGICLLKCAEGAAACYNKVNGSVNTGIVVSSVARATVNDNVVSGAQVHGIYFYGAGTTGWVERNEAWDNTQKDINIGDGVTATCVRDNQAENGVTFHKNAQYTVTRTSYGADDVTIGAIRGQTFSFKSKLPMPSIKRGSKALVENVDFVAVYSNNFNAGEALLTLYGIGDYVGYAQKPFTIERAHIEDASVYVYSDIFYTGIPAKPDPMLVYGGIWLRKGDDFKASYSNNVNVGTNATIALEGLGNFAYDSSVKYTIKAAHIASADFTVDSSGSKTPRFSHVGYYGADLQEGTDYKIKEWSGNKLPGTGYVVVEGIGPKFTGTVRVPYTVGATSIEGAKVVIEDQAYDGTAKTPYVHLTMANRTFSADDYTVTFKNNVNPGVATATITGIGDYTGTITATFNIVESKWTRIAGSSALNTMRAVIKQGFSPVTKTVVIATNANYKDALSAAALAGNYSAPILLTRTAALPGQTKSEITRLKATKAYIVGGVMAVNESVENELKAMGLTVQRIAGSNAPDTSRKVASEVGNPHESTSTVIIATSRDFADALSAAPWAYAFKAPIILTEKSQTLSQKSISLIRKLGFKRAVIVGGELAILPSVEGQLKEAGCTTVERISGKNAVWTSAYFAKWSLKNGFSLGTVGIATRGTYLDALTGAALMGKSKGPILLVSGGNKNAIIQVVKGNVAKVNRGYIFGGPAAISTDVENYLLTLK